MEGHNFLECRSQHLRGRSGSYLPSKTAEELRLSAHQPDSVMVGRGGGIKLWLLPGTQASRFPVFRQLMERSGCYPSSATAKLRLSAHQPDPAIEEQVGWSMVNGRGTWGGCASRRAQSGCEATCLCRPGMLSALISIAWTRASLPVSASAN